MKLQRSLLVMVCMFVLTCFGEETRLTHQDEEDNDMEQAVVEEVDKEFITDKEPFIPTLEWQTVRKGQAIPPGLHVRMNMQTGLTEAKVLDPNENTNQQPDADATALTMTDSSDDESEESKEAGRMDHMKEALQQAMKEVQSEEDSIKKKAFSREELKEALKRFKAEKDDVQEPMPEIHQNFRSIDELKKDLSDMDLAMKTDMEVLQELMVKYRDPTINNADKITVLTDLEYYVHQIDNAMNFADMGGLELVIKDLNSTEQDIRSEAAFVIGSATQSNPKVQISCIEGGALQQLIRMLPRETCLAVRSRIIYALSAIVRHFPVAQEKFLSQGGLDALRHLFNEAGVEKLQIKAVTLLTDMMNERVHGLKSTNVEKRKQYESIPLLDAIHDQGWCDLIPSLLNLPDHDYREKVLNIMQILLTECGARFSDTAAMLSSLRDEYEILAKDEASAEESEDLYFGKLFQSITSILEVVTEKDEL